MKDSIRYCLKIQTYTKKIKMCENYKTKLKMFMGEGRLEECNPEGTERRLQLYL